MSCPTCSKTMTAIVDGTFHCPCCGTLRIRDRHQDYDHPPSIISRMRLFVDFVTRCNDADVKAECIRLGIDEALWCPTERPLSGVKNEV